MPTHETIATSAEHAATEQVRSPAHPGNSTLIRYFVMFFAVSILIYPQPFWLVRLSSYPRWSRNASLRFLEFGFTAAGQNADVVIFGDSSATAGIDPSRISAALGERVLLLPSNLTELVAVDDFPLRRYIAADTPPRVIVFYFSPWDFNYDHDFDKHPMYDGVETVVRHGDAREIAAFVVAHPLYVIQFPLMFYQSTMNEGLTPPTKLRRQAQQLVATNGHTEFSGRLINGSSCTIPANFLDQIRFDSVRRISEKYRSSRTKILYFAAPIPGCTNAQKIVDRSSAVIPALPPEIMTPSVFVDDSYYAHLGAAGVPQATKNLTDAVRPILTGSDSAIGSR